MHTREFQPDTMDPLGSEPQNCLIIAAFRLYLNVLAAMQHRRLTTVETMQSAWL